MTGNENSRDPHNMAEIRIPETDPNALGKTGEEKSDAGWSYVQTTGNTAVDTPEEEVGMTPEEHQQAARETEEEKEAESMVDASIAALFDLAAGDLVQAVMDTMERSSGGTEVDSLDLTGATALNATVTPNLGVDTGAGMAV